MIGKLVIDFDEINLNELILLLSKYNFRCCIDDNCIYLSSAKGHFVEISNIMRELKIRNYFFKELTSPPTKTPTNYVQTWLLEKFQEQEIAKFNEQHQAELQKAQENIKKAQEEFLKVIEEYYNQGGAADGRK